MIKWDTVAMLGWTYIARYGSRGVWSEYHMVELEDAEKKNRKYCEWELALPKCAKIKIYYQWNMYWLGLSTNWEGGSGMQQLWQKIWEVNLIIAWNWCWMMIHISAFYLPEN